VSFFFWVSHKPASLVVPSDFPHDKMSDSRVSIKALTDAARDIGSETVLRGVPIGLSMREFIERHEEEHVLDHTAVRAAYHGGASVGEDKSPSATVRLAISADSTECVVEVAAGPFESKSVVVKSEMRADGPFLAFDTVVGVVAETFGVTKEKLRATMRFSGISLDRQGSNLLLKTRAVGKDLKNNPANRKTTKFTVEPHVRCDMCHETAEETWRREFEDSRIFVVVCHSQPPRCANDRVVIRGVERVIRKVHNKHKVVFA
jgi:hypothetical protein